MIVDQEKTPFELSMDRAAEREAQHVAHNRNGCLAECAPELAEHIANTDEARAVVDGLEHRLAELAPERVEAKAREALKVATAGGDAEAVKRAATALQQIKAGLDESTVERLTVEAKLVQARGDLASTTASLAKAEKSALRTRLASLDRDVERAVAGFHQIAQHAYERYALLQEIAKQKFRFQAAVDSTRVSVNVAALERCPPEIVLPTVFVPGVGEVQAIGRSTQR